VQTVKRYVSISGRQPQDLGPKAAPDHCHCPGPPSNHHNNWCRNPNHSYYYLYGRRCCVHHRSTLEFGAGGAGGSESSDRHHRNHRLNGSHCLSCRQGSCECAPRHPTYPLFSYKVHYPTSYVEGETIYYQDTDDEDDQVIRTYSTSASSAICKAHRRRYLFQKIVLNRRRMYNSGVCTVWEDNSPDSLVDLSAQCVLRNPQTLFADDIAPSEVPRLAKRSDSAGRRDSAHALHSRCGDDCSDGMGDSFKQWLPPHLQTLRLHPGLHLPADVCEKLLSTLYDLGLDLDDRIVRALTRADSLFRLARLNLRYSSVSDDGLTALLNRNSLRELDIVGCRRLTPASLEVLNNRSHHLVELNMTGLPTKSRDNIGCIFPSCVIDDCRCMKKRTKEKGASAEAATEEDGSGGGERAEGAAAGAEGAAVAGPAGVPTANGCPNGHVVPSGGGGAMKNADESDSSESDSDESEDDYDMDDYEWDEDDTESMKYSTRGFILKAPVLQRLCMRDMVVSGTNYFHLMFGSLRNLTHLDLSNCVHREGMSNFDWLSKYFGAPESHLYYLVLHNVPELTQDAITNNVCKLTKLRHLDISRFSVQDNNRGDYNYKKPNEVLRAIDRSLPLLVSLDISGTNLAGTGTFEWQDEGSEGPPPRHKPDWEEGPEGAEGGPSSPSPSSSSAAGEEVGEMPKCDIPGLVSRVKRPLNFLGLYKTGHDACYRAHIPAVQVSGEATEEQTLVAGRHYLSRPSVMESILNNLYNFFRYEKCHNYRGAIDIILMAMDRYPAEKVIQISGSACICYVVNTDVLERINVKVKRKIFSTLLNGMLAHSDDPVMMRNGCLALSQFRYAGDFHYDYERLVKALFCAVSFDYYTQVRDEPSFVLQAGITLLNTVACNVDGRQKLILGNMGVIEKMLELIKFRLNTRICDLVMETAWSTMWNVTDETPINCQRFLDGGGMKLFLDCKEEFPSKENLLRNMMGLLGNVAEVQSLRSKLMSTPFVREFARLLNSTLDGIEVSYNAAGVLAHLVSDGSEAWTILQPTREEVVDKMVGAIGTWDLKSNRNINYRSFEPILRLVRVTHTPQCRHWAVWALANLTTVDEKYCRLVDAEGGMVLLDELLDDQSPTKPYDRVLELATIVRNNVLSWKMIQDGHEQAKPVADDSSDHDDAVEEADDYDSEQGM